MNKYVPKYFKDYELLPPEVIESAGVNALLLMDERILIALDAVRKLIGFPVIVNNWHSGGSFTQRGFRTEVIGAKYSQHRYGRAVDFDVQGMTAEQVRNAIAGAWKTSTPLQNIRRMEADVSWVHIDCAPVECSNGPVIFKG